MIIRPATKFDSPKVLSMIKSFSEQNSMPDQLANDILDFNYIGSLFQHIILGGGVLLVAEKNNEVVGFIIGMKNNNVWYPNQITLNELMIWVEPKFRNGRAAYLLLKEYNKEAESMRQQKQITMYTMTKTKHFAQINFEKFGYSKIEETWAVGA
ncbi:MAG: GNAT family N-acetyltransferase [Candidatus Nanopelagicus sp.]